MKKLKFKQAKPKPCKECPYSRKNNLTGPNPGGSNPLVYVAQAMGPFWLPCHMDKNYNDKESDPTKVCQCSGAAIYRSNLNAPEMPENLSRLPSNTELVFASHGEFVSHYTGLPEDALDKVINENINLMVRHEMSKFEVKTYNTQEDESNEN